MRFYSYTPPGWVSLQASEMNASRINTKCVSYDFANQIGVTYVKYSKTRAWFFLLVSTGE